MGVLSIIKEFVTKAKYTNPSGQMFYYRVKYGSAKLMCALLGEKSYAKWFYHLYTGKTLNLDNPQTFNDKGWWLKLNNRNPLMTKCSDKFLAREYVKDCGYEDILIPQLDVFCSVKELDFAKYKESVIVKCNHNSGGHVFYDPRNPLSDKEIKQGKKKLNYILRQNASVLSREWNYKNIPPRLVVEKVIRDKSGNLPLDYRFFCFDGEPKLLMRDVGVLDSNGQYSGEYPRSMFDVEHKQLPIQWGRENYSGKLDKPENYDRMVEIARKLSQPFAMCRVDLYNVDGKIYFGEITFYHGGCCQNITPEEWEYTLGSWIDLNNPKIVRKE